MDNGSKSIGGTCATGDSTKDYGFERIGACGGIFMVGCGCSGFLIGCAVSKNPFDF